MVGLIGAFMLTNGLGFWFFTDAMNEMFALSTVNNLGYASIRADFGGFFLGAGLFAAYAAWRRDGQAALGAAVLFIIGFIGRVITLVLDGPVAGGVPPMVIEAMSASVLLWTHQMWQHE